MSGCRTCKHWSPPAAAAEQKGLCNLLYDPGNTGKSPAKNELAEVCGQYGYGAYLMTREGFICCLHEERT